MKRKTLLMMIPCLLSLVIIGCGNSKPKIVERPAFDAWNTSTLEIDKIEINDTATVFHIDAFFYPGQWIRIVKDTYIRESGKDEKLILSKTEGINIDEEFWMPESGETSFKLFFPPLKNKNAAQIDFIESDCDDCFKIWGIYLNGEKPALAKLPSQETTTSKPLPNPDVKEGVATLSIQMNGNIPAELFKGKDPTLYYKSIINTDIDKYELEFNPKDKTFKLEIPIINPTFSHLYSPFYNGQVPLVPNQETKIYVDYSKICKQQSRYQRDSTDTSLAFSIINPLNLSYYDLTYMDTFYNSFYSEDQGIKHDMTPDMYSAHILNIIDKYTRKANHDNKLSENMKQFIANEIKLSMLSEMFEARYISNLKRAYMEYHKLGHDQYDKQNFQPQKLNKSYYSFLSKFDLNSPLNIYSPSYSNIISEIRKLDVYKIPVIKETPTSGWLNIVKSGLKDDIGIDSGLFYDVLVASEYLNQLNDLQPLTEIQKKEIPSFFTNKTYTDKLLSENNNTLKLIEKNKNATDYIVNETPQVKKEKVLDAILAKYKGKVVFLDIWETWCGPCISAMKQAEPVKETFAGKDVVFVYIASHSSPLKTWSNKIPEIHGEHYRLTDEESQYISKLLNVSGIPSYVVYDKNGNQKHKNTGFMGVDKMKEWIEESL